MSYQALARKWRPRKFEDLVGQRHVVRALTHALSENKLHHALLFSGTRGVGKTTLGRIIAKCLNCERTDSTTAQPCVGEDACTSCREIDEGRFVDLIEVDAASRAGVNETRELMDNVHYAPTRGRVKVYLIDEVHMLSKHSFNALLKTLEEPPPRVQFLLATTEPEALPVTVLSRCLHFPLKRLPTPEIAGHLNHILDTEGYEAEDKAITEIARAADGSMRDSLSLLDQAIAFGGGKLEAEHVHEMLGTIGEGQATKLIEAIAIADTHRALEALDALYMQGMDMRFLLETIATAWQEIATCQLLGGQATEELAHWVELAERAEPGAIQLFYDIALSGLRDLSYAPDPLVGARMTILRMLAFVPQSMQNAETVPAAVEAGSKPARPVPNSTAVPKKPSASAPDGVQDTSQDTTTPEAPLMPPVSQPEPDRAAGFDGSDGTWLELVQKLGISGMAGQLARNGVCRDLAQGTTASSDAIDNDSNDHNVITLELPRAHEHLATDSARSKLQAALDKQWQPDEAPKLRIRMVDSVDDSPAQRAEQAKDARRQEAIQSIENDPNVRELQERLGARLRTDSIKPNTLDEIDQ